MLSVVDVLETSEGTAVELVETCRVRRLPYPLVSTGSTIALLALALRADPVRDDSWSTMDWVALGALPVATLATSYLDDDVRSFAQSHRGDRSDAAAAAFKPFGDGALLLPGAAGLWWAGANDRAPHLARASRDALEAWIVAQAGTQLLKYTCGRARPVLEEGNDSFTGLTIDDARHSFPSGHASNSWAVLGAYALEYRDVPWVSWPLWTLAAGVAASRVHDDQHWLSDVVSGSLIGLLSVHAVHAWNATPSTVTLLALPTPDGWTAHLSLPLPL